MATAIWKEWEDGLQYQQAMGFNQNFPLYERFKQGEQWPPATPRTRNLPRPVFNIIEMNIRHKRAAILSQPIAITYTPADTAENRRDQTAATTGANTYTDLADRLWAHAGQDTLNSHVVDDAATLGTGIWHFYWDTKADGPGNEPNQGDIRGEAIDPLCVVFANPAIEDVQKQPYIIIGRRTPVKEVMRLAKNAGLSPAKIADITADQSGPEGTYQKETQSALNEKCTLLTRYSKNAMGEVVFSTAVRGATIVEERPLTPAGSIGAAVNLYPLAVFTWRRRKGSIFGIGEVQELLPNQKAVNFNIAMLLLSVQQTAWPKLLTKPGALQQPVTNEPGEHIIDYYPGGDGIKFMQPPAFSGMAAALADKVVDLTRRVSGMSEVTTGEPLGGNMAASAILALQNQAKTPIEEIQKHFWHSIEQVGRIWLCFFGAYYGTVLPGKGTAAAAVNPGHFSRLAYNLSVNVGAASEFSRVLAQSTLDKMLDRGDIDIAEYLELSDPNIAPFKEQFKRLVAERTTKNAFATVPIIGTHPFETEEPNI